MSSSTTTSLVVNATSAEMNPSTYHHDINFDLSLVVFVIFLIALVWRLYFFIKHRNDPLLPPPNHPPSGAEDDSANTDKKIRQSPEAIEKLLVFKTVVRRRTGDEIVLGQDEMGGTMMKQSDLWLFLLDDEEEDPDVEATNGRRQRTCAICLGDYEPGDQICGSKNPDCWHYFHSTCGMEWLLAKHSQCPVCRADYLVEPEDCPADSKRNVNQEEQVPTRRMQTVESPSRIETSTVNDEA